MYTVRVSDEYDFQWFTNHFITSEKLLHLFVEESSTTAPTERLALVSKSRYMCISDERVLDDVEVSASCYRAGKNELKYWVGGATGGVVREKSWKLSFSGEHNS